MLLFSYSHNAVTHWTKLTILSCYSLMLSPKSNLSHCPRTSLCCVVFHLFWQQRFCKLKIRIWGTPPKSSINRKGLGCLPSFPFCFLKDQVSHFPVRGQPPPPAPRSCRWCRQQTLQHEHTRVGPAREPCSRPLYPESWSKAGRKVFFNWE